MKNSSERFLGGGGDEQLKEAVDVDSLHARMESEKLSANNERAKAVVRALMNLGLELGDKASDFDTVLSDDVGGRLPALFLRGIIDTARKEEGKDPLQTFFISGGYVGPEREYEVEKFIESNKEKLGRTLFVTEYISTGDSIGRLSDLLHRNGVDFDIAVVSSLVSGSDLARNVTSRDRIHIGEIGGAALEVFFRNVRTAGVDKNLKSRKTAHPGRSNQVDMAEMTKARNDMNVLAEEVSKLLVRGGSEKDLERTA